MDICGLFLHLASKFLCPCKDLFFRILILGVLDTILHAYILFFGECIYVCVCVDLSVFFSLPLLLLLPLFVNFYSARKMSQHRNALYKCNLISLLCCSRVDGVKVGDEIRELLFCLPRIVEDQVSLVSVYKTFLSSFL